MRLVVELEKNLAGIGALVALRDLLPHRDKAFLEHDIVDRLLVAIERFTIQLTVMMHIDDDVEIAPQRLVKEIHGAAINSGIAEPVAVRTRLKRREHYRVGDGSAENAFVHIDIRARKGRTLEQKKHAVQTIYDQANKTLEPVFRARPLALTVEIHEIDPETRLLRNGMRERKADAA